MPAKVKSLEFLLIYALNLDETLEFYTKYFGYEKQFDMDEDGSQFGSIGEVGIWIGPGFEKVDKSHADKFCRSTAMLGIDDARNLYKEFVKDGVNVYQEEPVEMRQGIFWFQFSDPSGNVLEVLGA